MDLKISQHDVGTRGYRAPEVTMLKDYDEKCDIFSLGVILFAMLINELPFSYLVRKITSDHSNNTTQLQGQGKTQTTRNANSRLNAAGRKSKSKPKSKNKSKSKLKSSSPVGKKARYHLRHRYIMFCDDNEQYWKKFKNGNSPNSLDSSANKLIYSMMHYNPLKRLSSSQIIKNEWYNEIVVPDEQLKQMVPSMLKKYSKNQQNEKHKKQDDGKVNQGEKLKTGKIVKTLKTVHVQTQSNNKNGNNHNNENNENNQNNQNNKRRNLNSNDDDRDNEKKDDSDIDNDENDNNNNNVNGDRSDNKYDSNKAVKSSSADQFRTSWDLHSSINNENDDNIDINTKSNQVYLMHHSNDKLSSDTKKEREYRYSGELLPVPVDIDEDFVQYHQLINNNSGNNNSSRNYSVDVIENTLHDYRYTTTNWQIVFNTIENYILRNLDGIVQYDKESQTLSCKVTKPFIVEFRVIIYESVKWNQIGSSNDTDDNENDNIDNNKYNDINDINDNRPTVYMICLEAIHDQDTNEREFNIIKNKIMSANEIRQIITGIPQDRSSLSLNANTNTNGNANGNINGNGSTVINIQPRFTPNTSKKGGLLPKIDEKSQMANDVSPLRIANSYNPILINMQQVNMNQNHNFNFNSTNSSSTPRGGDLDKNRESFLSHLSQISTAMISTNHGLKNNNYEYCINNPLVIIMGIGDYDKDIMPSLSGVKQDYINSISVFLKLGYCVLYQYKNNYSNTNNNINSNSNNSSNSKNKSNVSSNTDNSIKINDGNHNNNSDNSNNSNNNRHKHQNIVKVHSNANAKPINQVEEHKSTITIVDTSEESSKESNNHIVIITDNNNNNSNNNNDTINNSSYHNNNSNNNSKNKNKNTNKIENDINNDKMAYIDPFKLRQKGEKLDLKKCKENVKIYWLEEEIYTFFETAKEMVLKYSHDSCIFILSGHGDSESVIIDSKGDEVSLDGLFNYFNGNECRYLVDKPKIIFVDACRGSLTNKAITIESGKPKLHKSHSAGSYNYNYNSNNNTMTNNSENDNNNSKHSNRNSFNNLQQKILQQYSKTKGKTKSNTKDKTKGKLKLKTNKSNDNSKNRLNVLQKRKTKQFSRSLIFTKTQNKDIINLTQQIEIDIENDSKMNEKNVNNSTNNTININSNNKNKQIKVNNNWYHSKANFVYIYANPDGFAVADGGEYGGYLIRSMKQVFWNQELIFNQTLNETIQQIRSRTKQLAGKGTVECVEHVSTMTYKVRFQERQLKLERGTQDASCSL